MTSTGEHTKRGTVSVLLREDVDCLGRKGDIVAVKSGYARNYLLPRQLALVADANAMRMREQLREARMKQAALDRESSEALAVQINGLTLPHHVKVDHEGHLYGSVAVADIVRVLESEGVTVDKKFIQLKQPLRKIGLHTIHLHLLEGVTCSFKLKVLPEGMDELPEEPVEVVPLPPAELDIGGEEVAEVSEAQQEEAEETP